MKRYFSQAGRLAAVLVLGFSVSACGGSGGDNPGDGNLPGTAADTSPDPVRFAVPVVDKMAPGLALKSAPVFVKGIDEGVSIPASVEGGLIAVNSETDFAEGPVEVRLDDRVLVRTTAPDQFSASHTATLTLGEGESAQSADFTLETGESEFSVEAGLKSLTFKWGAMEGVEYFKLFENADGASGFSEVELEIAGDAVEATLPDIPVHMIDWSSARYQLHACNGYSGCVSIPQHDVPVTGLMDNILPQMLKAANAEAGDEFGYSVALSADGNTLAVGARSEDATPIGGDSNAALNDTLNSGAVYIFNRIEGIWQQTGYVKPNVGDAQDKFGISIALDDAGTTLLVGAVFEDGSLSGESEGDALDNAGVDSGAAYVFELVDGAWRQKAYLKAVQPEADDQFGISVALSGDGTVAVIGALEGDSVDPGTGTVIDDTGSAHVFHREEGHWIRDGILIREVSETGDIFGYSVTINGAGDLIAVSAIEEDSNATGANGDPRNNLATDSGAVYVFHRVDGEWAQRAYLKAGNSGAGDQFGIDLSMNRTGDRLAVGAYREDSSTDAGSDDLLLDSGAAYVFDRVGTDWIQSQILKAPVPENGDIFGWKIDLSGDGGVVAISAIAEDSAAIGIGGDMQDNSAVSAGALYLFRRSTSGDWHFINYLKASNTGLGDFFGYDVALSREGRQLASGAMLEDSPAPIEGEVQPDSNSANKAGAAYVY